MSTADQLLADGVVRQDVPLGPFTTYKAGGPARLFAEVDDMDGLARVVGSGLTRERNILVLGRGSNLVVADAGFDGLVVHLGGEFAAIEVNVDLVTAGGAAPLPRVARTAVEAGVLGLEFFVGVPGSVGGGVRQNAGCFGVETADRLISATIFDLIGGEPRDVTPGDLDLSYRHSNINSDELVVSASFRGEVGAPESGKRRMREITRWRRDNQPGGTLNAGSVFKNPSHVTAGELIDSLGLKGTSVGDVSVSEKHANFFVAGPQATANEIRELVGVVKDSVYERSGTILEPEIQFVGFET
jgi:UDP-N-acetylmuramate dehydrogenase